MKINKCKLDKLVTIKKKYVEKWFDGNYFEMKLYISKVDKDRKTVSLVNNVGDFSGNYKIKHIQKKKIKQ